MIFPITYTVINIGVVSSTIAYSTIDGLFYTFGSNIVIHLKLLQQRYKSLSEKKVRMNKTELDNLVEYHNEISYCCKLLNEIFFPLLIVQFLLISVTVGMVAIQMAWAEGFLQKISAFGYAFGAIAGLFFYVFTGSDIIEEVEKFEIIF